MSSDPSQRSALVNFGRADHIVETAIYYSEICDCDEPQCLVVQLNRIISSGEHHLNSAGKSLPIEGISAYLAGLAYAQRMMLRAIERAASSDTDNIIAPLRQLARAYRRANHRGQSALPPGTEPLNSPKRH